MQSFSQLWFDNLATSQFMFRDSCLEDESVHSMGGEACQPQEPAGESQGRRDSLLISAPVVPDLDVFSDFPDAEHEAMGTLPGLPGSLAASARLSSGGSASSKDSCNSADSTRQAVDRCRPGGGGGCRSPAGEVASTEIDAATAVDACSAAGGSRSSGSASTRRHFRTGSLSCAG